MSPAAGAAFAADQRKCRWGNQSQNQNAKHYGFEDENDVPRIPFLGKWPERAHAVVIGEVEQDVAKPSETRVQEKQSPTRRQSWIFYLAAAQAPDQIDEAENYCSVDWNPEERMRESAMMSESKGRPFDAAEHIQIRSFGGERKRKCGQRCLAIEPGAAQACAGQKVSDGFQVV